MLGDFFGRCDGFAFEPETELPGRHFVRLGEHGRIRTEDHADTGTLWQREMHKIHDARRRLFEVNGRYRGRVAGRAAAGLQLIEDDARNY